MPTNPYLAQTWTGEGSNGAPWNASMTSMPAPAGYNPGMDLLGVQNGVQMHPDLAGMTGALSGRTGYGGMTRGDIFGMKADPSTAGGTPYGQFMTGGNGNGPVDFNKAAALGYWRNNGVMGPGQARAGMAMRQGQGPRFGPNAGGLPQTSNGVGFGQMPTNPGYGGGIGTQAGGPASYYGGPSMLPPMGTGSGLGTPQGYPGLGGGIDSGPRTAGQMPMASGGFAPKPPTGMAHIDGAPPAGSYGGGFQPIGGASQPGVNPYLGAQIGSLAQQYQNQLTRNVIPAIDSRAIMAGGYGSARNGIAVGTAAGDSMRGFADAATGLLGGDWTNQQSRNLTNQGQMLGYASDQRSQDRADLLAGSSLYQMGTSGQWDPLRNANGIYGTYTGFGNNTTSQGGGAMGGLGGALAGSVLYKNLFGTTPGGAGTVG